MNAKPFDGPLKSISFHIRYNMEIVDLRIVPEFLFTDVFFFYRCLEFFLFICFISEALTVDITNREKLKAPIYSPNISRYQ